MIFKIKSLINQNVRILENDVVPISQNAYIKNIQENEEKILLQLVEPLLIDKRLFSYAIARPRSINDDLSTLINSGTLSSSITWIPQEQFNQDTPFDLSWWRGGAAAIADLVLTK